MAEGREPEGEGRTGESKAAWRARFRAYRAALSDEDYTAKSAAICERLLALPAVQAAETVHGYWPLVARREVDTRPFVAACLRAGKRVVLPVVDAFADAPRMVHRVYEGEAHLVANRWGLLEPTGPLVDASDLDVIVVPAFGADRRGHRVGHGRGFYDAFLAGTDALRVAAVYDACLVERLPSEPHDVAMDVVVTEARTVRLSR